MRRLSPLIRLAILVVVVTTSACRGSQPAPPSEATAEPARATEVATPHAQARATETVTPQAQATAPSRALVRKTSPTPTQAGMWIREELPDPSVNMLDAIAVAVGHQGTVHLVSAGWRSSSGKYAHLIFYQSRAVAGPWSEPLEIFTTDLPSPSGSVKIAIAVDSHNVPHVIRATDNAISLGTVGKDGSWSWSVVVDPAACPDCRLSQPEIVIDAADQIHLLWTDSRNYGIFWSSRPVACDWSAPIEISSENEQDRVRVAGGELSVDASGTLHAVWRQRDSHIMYSYKLPTGPWSAPVMISGASQLVSDPVLAVDSADSAHVVWSDRTRSPGNAELLYTCKPSGDAWTQPAAVPVAIPGQAGAPTLTVVGGDNLILMWGSKPIGYATKRAEEFWSEETNIPDPSGWGCAVASDPLGSVHVTWKSQGLHYTAESFARIALPPAVTAEYTVPSGLVEFTISAGPGKRFHPAISGDVVVWGEQEEQDWDIFGYDLSAESRFTITTHEGDQRSPAVSGNIVVWQDGRAISPRIYGYDLSTQQTFPVTAEASPQFRPDISGSTVVFRDWRKTGRCSWGSSMFGPGTSCDWDIWGADLDGGAEFPIRTEKNVQAFPRVSGNTVVWAEELEDSGWIIYGKQLDAAAQPFQIATGPGSSVPRPEIDGSIVIWEEWRGREEWIYGYHLLTKSGFLISTGPGHKDDPDISGNVVVWADKRSGDTDIYGYDLASGKEFPICTATGDQESPAIDGDVVVWVDKRNSYTEIYGARLPSISTEQTMNIIPVPTHTPTITPTPKATAITPPSPKLLSPANNSLVDTLLPVFRVDLGESREIITSYLDLRGEAIWDAYLSFKYRDATDRASSIEECVPRNNLQPDTTYTWQLDARYKDCRELDCRVYSEEWTFTTPSKPVALPAPALVSPADGTTVDRADVVFQWDAVEGATSYQVGWGDRDPDHFLNHIDTEVPQPVSPPYTPLKPGTLYYWGVRARNYYGWSEWAERTFKTSP